MLTRMHLKNFKGFRDTEIPEFRKVNLIVGGQNVGKTSLLEAVVFMGGTVLGTSAPGSRYRLPNIFRPGGEKNNARFWRGIFGTIFEPSGVLVEAMYNNNFLTQGGIDATYNSSVNVEYFSKENSPQLIKDNIRELVEKHNLVDIHIPIYPFSIFTKDVTEQVEMYGQLVTKKKKKKILELLKKIDSRVEGIDAVAPDGEHLVYVELSNNSELLPLSQLGHGFTRLFELYTGLAVTDSKLALIDEIENGIHYSALPTVFQGIRELSESSGVQSIITTHSLECIQAAYEVFKDKPEDFQIIRLERTEDDNVRAVAVNDENLATVMASGWEIR